MWIYLIVLLLINISFAIEVFDEECSDSQDCRQFFYDDNVLRKTFNLDSYEIVINSIDYESFVYSRNIARSLYGSEKAPFEVSQNYKFLLSNKEYQLYVGNDDSYCIKIKRQGIGAPCHKILLPIDLSLYSLDLRDFGATQNYWDGNDLVLTFYTANRLPHLCEQVRVSNITSHSVNIATSDCVTPSLALYGGFPLSSSKKFQLDGSIIYVKNDKESYVKLFDIKELFLNKESLIEGFWLSDNTLYVSRTSIVDFEGPISLIKINLNEIINR